MPNDDLKYPRRDTLRKKDTRATLREQRIEDPRFPLAKILVSTSPDCPHGTEYGYNEFSCRCLDLGPPAPEDPNDPNSPMTPTGCGPAGVRASATRRSVRRNALADTIPFAVYEPPGHDSALAQLDNAQLGHAQLARIRVHRYFPATQ